MSFGGRTHSYGARIDIFLMISCDFMKLFNYLIAFFKVTGNDSMRTLIVLPTLLSHVGSENGIKVKLLDH